MFFKKEKDIRLGGLLFIPFISFHFAPAVIIYQTVAFILNLYSGVWVLFADSASQFFSPLIAIIFVAQIFANFILAGWALLILYLFYSYSEYVPKTVVYYYLASVFLVLIDFGVISFMLDDIYPKATNEVISQISPQLVISIVAACVWIPYFTYSKRVKNTFGVRR